MMVRIGQEGERGVRRKAYKEERRREVGERDRKERGEKQSEWRERQGN